VAERILVTVRSSPITTRTIPVSLTASIGLASALPGEPLDHLLARADAALYQAKRDGRDRLSVAS
jgi:diguanylate cyclase (GGDEF)-like protein